MSKLVNGQGRVKSIAETVRAAVGSGGERLVEVAMAILSDPKANRRDRLEALKWLGDRGFGRATETSLSLTGTVSGQLTALPDHNLAKFVRRYLSSAQAVGPAVDPETVDAIPSDLPED